MLLPPASQFNAPSTTQAQFQAAMAQFLAFVASLLGADGSPATARQLLGLGDQPTVFNYRGAYAQSTAYAFLDVVKSEANSGFYLCITPYTSPSSGGDPSTDTTHWQLQQGELPLTQMQSETTAVSISTPNIEIFFNASSGSIAQPLPAMSTFSSYAGRVRFKFWKTDSSSNPVAIELTSPDTFLGPFPSTYDLTSQGASLEIEANFTLGQWLIS